MRKRLVVLLTPVLLAVALAMPAATSASSLGSIKITSSYCTGGTIHATFKVIKNSGHYATRFTLTATGQGAYGGGSWHNEGSKKYSYTIYSPWAKAYFSKTLKFNSSYTWSRLQGVAKFYDGRYLIGTAKIATGYC